MKDWSGEEHIVELEDNNDITNYSYKIEKSDKNNYDNKYEKKRKKKEIIKF